MVQRDKLKNIVKITSSKSSGTLVVSATSESYSISLESQDPDGSAPNTFFIDGNSDEYHSFCAFFSKCKNITNSNILIDDKNSIEHAPLLIYSKKGSLIGLQFAVEHGFDSKITHSLKSSNKELTRQYFELFKSLQSLKRKNNISILNGGMLFS